MKKYWLILTLAVALSIGCNASSGVPGASTPATVDETPIALPNAEGSLKFVVLGDFGTGGRSQYDLAATMARFHDKFKFDTVITVGDNLYGSQRPRITRQSSRYRTSLSSTPESSSTPRSAITTRASSRTTRCSTWAASSTTRSSLPTSRCASSCSIRTTRRPSNSPGSRGS